jgi:copper chaperone CopZ
MCEAHPAQAALAQQSSAGVGVAVGRAYAVEGMTCDHCATSVSEEVRQVSGVTGIEVDLQAGRLVVGGEGFTDDAVRAAVGEAGYRVAGS